ncbi:TRAP transporter substrate-binding protein DctP [Microbaculum marinum]|uniref:TRAP transporter substrate-binding protein DctP n=1 Tax=Microbaculum marinum TaxID=1764581 RepID=A0AAW9RI94_9HYPH
MKLFKSILVAATLVLPALPAAAKEYRLLSSWDGNYAYNPYILDPFVEQLKEATDGRISISVSGPETVPPFEQLEPVGSGVFQFLFTHGAYHAGTTPIMLAADALHGDLDAVRESGIFDELDKIYQKYNLKLVMLPITPEGAYHILLREPVNDNGDLEGRKIRGSLSYKGVVEMLGAVLVVMPPSEIYTGLEKGVIDGAAWPIIGALDYKWYEVAPYLLRPGFGVNYEPIFMNLDAWNALSEEDQKAVMDVSAKIEDSWYKDAPEVWKKEEDELKARGMKVTEMGDKQKAELGNAWAAALWTMAEEKDPEAAKQIRDFARSKGLTD